MIILFWGDVDTRPYDGGYIWYRITDSTDLLQQARETIQSAYPSVPEIDYLLIATWYHVGYYPENTDRVKFCITVLWTEHRP